MSDKPQRPELQRPELQRPEFQRPEFQRPNIAGPSPLDDIVAPSPDVAEAIREGFAAHVAAQPGFLRVVEERERLAAASESDESAALPALRAAPPAAGNGVAGITQPKTNPVPKAEPGPRVLLRTEPRGLIPADRRATTPGLAPAAQPFDLQSDLPDDPAAPVSVAPLLRRRLWIGLLAAAAAALLSWLVVRALQPAETVPGENQPEKQPSATATVPSPPVPLPTTSDLAPSVPATAEPSGEPSAEPSAEPRPSAKPSASPTSRPTATASAKPTAVPTAKPTSTNNVPAGPLELNK